MSNDFGIGAGVQCGLGWMGDIFFEVKPFGKLY
jgi:hypothetical protein